MVTAQNNRQLNKGFTLIELMLATALLMMIMFSGYYAYSLYSQKWQKRVDIFWQSTEQAIALDALTKVITSAVPYAINGENKKSYLYFMGTQTSVSFVSSAALFSDNPVVVDLTLVPGKQEGMFDLLYREANQNFLLVNLEAQPAWSHEVLLLTDIQNFSFSYFGWETFEQALTQLDDENPSNEDTRKWHFFHDIHKSRMMPEQMQVSFQNEKSETNFTLALTQNSIYPLLTYMRIDY